MRKLDLLTPAEAMAKLSGALDAAGFGIAHGVQATEVIPTAQACHRVLARDVVSPIPMPEFRRSTVDGYAVRADATPGTLSVIGEVRMGEVASFAIRHGEAALVHTGGNLPEGADAVVMLEDAVSLTPDDRQPMQAVEGAPPSVTQQEQRKIQTGRRLAPGENVIQQGEDVRAGEVVVCAGMRLREQEIGGLLALGITQVEVVRKPRVALIASGDELVPAEAETRPGQVRNINAPMLAALVARNGGEPLDFGILPDARAAFEQAAQRAMREADMVIFMAGSSVGERDFVPDVVNAMGKPGILAHGILFRPGKPTLFALCDGKPVFGLPGNPISALVTGMLFAMPTLWRIQGVRNPPQPRFTRAVLAREVKSPRDLEHWFPVRLEEGAAPAPHEHPMPSAEPISTKSNLIFGLVRADGIACAPIGVDRLAAGTEIQVRMFD
ncbi:MAG: molybdopterin molybdotransferase MoeA [Thermoflexales bacterium]|nr:molybdopterin molybdotransferase MoeA [Thermoflexales bacterium]MDW8351254.1 molybdopterin molybdotransferase MoeA [Anaerolineae bacterium]